MKNICLKCNIKLVRNKKRENEEIMILAADIIRCNSFKVKIYTRPFNEIKCITESVRQNLLIIKASI